MTLSRGVTNCGHASAFLGSVQSGTVNDDLRLHEVDKASSILVGLHSRDHLVVLLVNDRLEMVLHNLVEVKVLKVIDDRDVIDELST